MPSGAIGYQTLASNGVSCADPTDPNNCEERTFSTVSLDPARLVVGTNVIAVEIHQRSVTSDDISFDVELLSPLGTVTLTRNRTCSWPPRPA